MFDRAGAERLLAPGSVVATGTACVVFLLSFFLSFFFFPFLSFFFVFSFSFFLLFFFVFSSVFFCFLSSPPVHKGTESSAHHGYSL